VSSFPSRQSPRAGRRSALALIGGVGVAALFPPVTASGANSVLDVVAWKGQFPDDEVARFAERTGILVQLLEVRSDRDFLNLMRSTGGREFDLLFPSNTYAHDWSEFGLLRAFSEEELPLNDIHPALMRASESDWGFGNGLLWVPHLWVGELACWRGDAEWTTDSGRPSYGELWDAEASERIAGRAHSLLVGAGLYLEASGGLPQGSMAGALEVINNDPAVKAIFINIFRVCKIKAFIFCNDITGVAILFLELS